MNLTMNTNSILKETEKALLIKVQNKDEAFWYPKRFCKFSGKNNYKLHIWGGENFKIKVFKHKTKTKVDVGEFPLSYANNEKGEHGV